MASIGSILPSELLVGVAHKIDDVISRISFSMTCKSFRSLLSDNKPVSILPVLQPYLFMDMCIRNGYFGLLKWFLEEATGNPSLDEGGEFPFPALAARKRNVFYKYQISDLLTRSIENNQGDIFKYLAEKYHVDTSQLQLTRNLGSAIGASGNPALAELISPDFFKTIQNNKYLRSSFIEEALAHGHFELLKQLFPDEDYASNGDWWECVLGQPGQESFKTMLLMFESRRSKSDTNILFYMMVACVIHGDLDRLRGLVEEFGWPEVVDSDSDDIDADEFIGLGKIIIAAASHCHVHILKALKELKYPQDLWQQEAVTDALKRGNKEVVEIFFSEKPPKYPRVALRLALRSGDLDFIVWVMETLGIHREIDLSLEDFEALLATHNFDLLDHFSPNLASLNADQLREAAINAVTREDGSMSQFEYIIKKIPYFRFPADQQLNYNSWSVAALKRIVELGFVPKRETLMSVRFAESLEAFKYLESLGIELLTEDFWPFTYVVAQHNGEALLKYVLDTGRLNKSNFPLDQLLSLSVKNLAFCLDRGFFLPDKTVEVLIRKRNLTVLEYLVEKRGLNVTAADIELAVRLHEEDAFDRGSPSLMVEFLQKAIKK